MTTTHAVTSPIPSYPKTVIRNGRAYVDSRNVAATFGKRHNNVVRTIEGLIDIEPKLHVLNFEQMIVKTAIGKGATRDDKAYYLDRDGFALLVMGFTGRTSMIWKLRYIEAFNRMEAELASRRAPARRNYNDEALDKLMDSRDLLTVAWTALQAESFHDRETIRSISNVIYRANQGLELPFNELNDI